MSKHLIIIILSLCVSFISNASENEFWETKNDLQKNMLVSEEIAKNLVQKLEQLNNKSKVTTTMASALFEAKLDFLEFYGTPQDLKSHLEVSVFQIAKSHSFYNIYLSKLAILHFEFGELDKYTEVIEKIKNSNEQIFSAVTELITTPSYNNFQSVSSYCNDNCDFYLYHNAIANYYAVTGQYHALKKYVVNLLNTKYEVNGFYDAIKRRNILAYLYIASKCNEPNKDYLKEFHNDILANIEYLKASSARINETLDISCM